MNSLFRADNEQDAVKDTDYGLPDKFKLLVLVPATAKLLLKNAPLSCADNHHYNEESVGNMLSRRVGYVLEIRRP